MMNQVIRYAVSGVIGMAVTAALFVGMLGLMKAKKTTLSGNDPDLNFQFVRGFEEPKVKPPKTREIPPKPEVTQTPAAPTMSPINQPTPELNLASHGVNGPSQNVLKGVQLPGLGSEHALPGGDGGTLKNGIAPMYPPQEMMKRTEGWVKVLINVNEMGLVSSVSVVAAEPRKVFNAAALKAIKKWKFHPKMVSGQSVPFQVTQTVEFKIDQ